MSCSFFSAEYLFVQNIWMVRISYNSWNKILKSSAVFSAFLYTKISCYQLCWNNQFLVNLFSSFFSSAIILITSCNLHWTFILLFWSFVECVEWGLMYQRNNTTNRPKMKMLKVSNATFTIFVCRRFAWHVWLYTRTCIRKNCSLSE